MMQTNVVSVVAHSVPFSRCDFRTGAAAKQFYFFYTLQQTITNMPKFDFQPSSRLFRYGIKTRGCRDLRKRSTVYRLFISVFCIYRTLKLCKYFLFEGNGESHLSLNVCCPLHPQENPSEEDASVVDKIMSSRIIKNEVGIFCRYDTCFYLIALFLIKIQNVLNEMASNS